MLSTKQAKPETNEAFPTVDEISNGFQRGLSAEGEQGFYNAHNHFLKMAGYIFSAVRKTDGAAIPEEVVKVLAQQLNYFINTDNSILEQLHGGVRRELTFAVDTAFRLILISPDAEFRKGVADIALLAVKNHQRTVS